MLARASTRPFLRSTCVGKQFVRNLGDQDPFRVDNPRQLKETKAWLKSFNLSTVPRDIGRVTYSRSSGPGGQNVNKVNSKATLKIPLEELFQKTPQYLHPYLRRSMYVSRKTKDIVIQCQETRSQSTNLDRCYEKLYEMVISAGKSLPGQATDVQKEKVRRLQRAYDQARVDEKKKHSGKKSFRHMGRGRTSDY